jgi:LacI family transcriptional regulator
LNIKSLANELGLSIGTVSKALRNSHEISEATKERVLAKAREFNYQVNPFASSLRKQKSKTVAVVIPEVANNFFALAINGIEAVAQAKGYHVLIYLTHEDVKKEITIAQLLLNGRVDGILISLSAQSKSKNHLMAIREKEIPLVFFDRVAEEFDVPKIVTDDFEVSIKATEHLIKNGCRKIGFLSLSKNTSIENGRKRGFLEALQRNNLIADERLQIDYEDESITREKIKKLLIGPDKPDGLFASVEKLAVMTYEICLEIGIYIPKDLKIIGFSNLYTAALLNPALTTVTQPAFEIGKQAATILFKMIEKKGHNFLQERTVIPSKLIIRGSSVNE